MPQEVIANDDVNYALGIVKSICAEVGPGLPGTPQERKRAGVIKRELETQLGAGNVVTEAFTVAPGAFLGFLRLTALFTLVAVLMNISTGRFAGIHPSLTAVAALASSTVSVLLFVLQFIYGFELVDPFFGKKQSVNVVGKLSKPGTTDAKQLLILSGHHDSAWENNWFRLPGYGFYVATTTWVVGLIVMPVVCVVQLIGVVTGNIDVVNLGTLNWVLLIYPIVPSIIYPLLYYTGRKEGGTVPGAADNLAACAIVVAMSRFLAKNPEYIPADTEIRFVTFGSEEAGLRGSRRYVEHHLNELKRLDARLLNFESIAYPEISILTSEVNGTVKNSPEMVNSVIAAADTAGVPYKVKSASLGVSNDAGPFSRAGVKATTVLGLKMPQQLLAFYHQPQDTPKVVTTEPLLNVLKLAFEWVRNGGE